MDPTTPTLDDILQPVQSDGRSLSDRAVEALTALISMGEYQAGDKLPTEQTLAERLQISRATVREAIGFLQSHGLVTRRRGSGTFVGALPPSHLQGGLERLESVRALATRTGLQVTRESWKVEMVSAPAELAKVLALQPGVTLVRAEMTSAISGRLFAYMDGYVPHRLLDIDLLRAYEGGSMLDLISDQQTFVLSHTRTEIYSVKAPPNVASELGILPTDPVLHLAETYYDETGRPVVRYLNYFLTDYFNFHILRRVPAYSWPR